MGDKFSNSRKKGKDKAKDHFKRNGKYNSKSIRTKQNKEENSIKKRNLIN
jgi:hypothetical protein